MAKWDLSKLPEGRKPLPDEWFAERAQMLERINGLEAENVELKNKLVGALLRIPCPYDDDVDPYHRAEFYREREAAIAKLTGGKDE